MSLELVVGRIARVHGLRGELQVEPRTDSVEVRFAAGSVLRTGPAANRGGPPPVSVEPLPTTLSVEALRWHSGRLMVSFVGVHSRAEAEALRGVMLSVLVDESDRPEDPEEFYDHQLEGCRVVDTDNVFVGTLREVLHLPSQDVLEVVLAADERVILVPFVSELVPTVDLATMTVVVRTDTGLLDEPDGEPVGEPDDDEAPPVGPGV